MHSQDKPDWYTSTPVRFECTGCSDCCKRDGMVEFTSEDIARISAHRGEDPEVFKALYLEESHGALVVVVSTTEPCIFLDDHGRCGVHEVKPIQCSSYPFWPELLTSEHAWQEEAHACEGIGRGEPIGSTEVNARTLKELPLDEVLTFIVHEAKTTD